MTVRVGLVGAGAVATRHARVLTTFPDVDLVAVHDPDEPAAQVLASTCGAAVSGGVDDLLRRDLDAVWICVPPFAHGDLELGVIRAGLPFFVEKPLAADVATAVTVAEAVAAAGLATATGYHWRHLDTVARARAALAATTVRLVDARWWGTTPPPAWWSRLDRSGGQVLEQATHVLDLLRLLAGEVAEVAGAAAASSRRGRDVPDATAAVLRFESGAVGTATTSCVLPAPVAAGVEVAADGVAVGLTETELRLRTPDGDERISPEVDARTAVDRAFVDLLHGADPAPGLVDVTEALRTHRLAAAVTEAAHAGTTVRVAGR